MLTSLLYTRNKNCSPTGKQTHRHGYDDRPITLSKPCHFRYQVVEAIAGNQDYADPAVSNQIRPAGLFVNHLIGGKQRLGHTADREKNAPGQLLPGERRLPPEFFAFIRQKPIIIIHLRIACFQFYSFGKIFFCTSFIVHLILELCQVVRHPAICICQISLCSIFPHPVSFVIFSPEVIRS